MSHTHSNGLSNALWHVDRVTKTCNDSERTSITINHSDSRKQKKASTCAISFLIFLSRLFVCACTGWRLYPFFEREKVKRGREIWKRLRNNAKKFHHRDMRYNSIVRVAERELNIRMIIVIAFLHLSTDSLGHDFDSSWRFPLSSSDFPALLPRDTTSNR